MDRIEKSRNLIHSILWARVQLRQKIQLALREKGVDISYEMLQVLGCLSHRAGLTQQELAREVVKEKAALTILLNNMEEKDLIYRMVDEKDRRNRLIFLTERALELMKEVRPFLDSFYVSICDLLGKEDVELGTHFIQRFARAVDEAGF